MRAHQPDTGPTPHGPVDEGGYAALVNSLGGIVWEADGRTFQFIFVSPQAEAVLGYPARQWLDQPDFWLAHTHPDDANWCSAFCRDAVACGRDHEFEYRMLAADGRVVWLRDVVTVVCNGDGTVRLRGIMLDVSARKRLEDERLQSSKLEAVGRLAGGVAHDFNNLLTVINGYADLLPDTLPTGHPAADMAGQIRAAGERAAALTRQLLAFGRRSVVSPRPIDLSAVVSGLGELLGRVLGEGVRVTTDLATDLWTVRADPGQVEQVVVNLCVNARDALPCGGRLSVVTRNVTLAAPLPGDGPGRAGDYVILTVTDAGAGIPAEVLPHIFEPFFTTKGVGTGLGLATVYGIVRSAGGHVVVDSAVGRGTEVRVYLPRCDEAPATRPAPARVSTPVGTETILLAEDDDSLRALGRAVLEGCGYVVLDADDGRAAVELAGSFEGRIDLLVTDVVMPEMGGRETAEELVRLRPDVRVLFVSGYPADEAVRHGIREAEVAYLQKPFAPADLARKVREVLDGQ